MPPGAVPCARYLGRVKLSGLLRRAAPFLLAGAAGAVLNRYVEIRLKPRRALPSPAWPTVPAPPVPPARGPDLPRDAEVRAYRVADEEDQPAPGPVAVAVTPAEEAAAETSERDALDPDAIEHPDYEDLDDGEDPEGERPKTVDFEALALHPALSHAPPIGDSPELVVRAAIADVSVVHASGVEVEVRDGVAYLRGEVASAEAIGAMHRRATELPEIRAVENLMYLPGTPPPGSEGRG